MDIKTLHISLGECVRLCEELVECLTAERQFLIEFKMNELLQNNIRKESLLGDLMEKRRSIRDHLEASFGVSTEMAMECQLEEPVLGEWRLLRQKWVAVWERAVKQCRENQLFIERSQKNLEVLADHFKRLFGENTRYSSTGQVTELHAEGSVLEGAF